MQQHASFSDTTLSCEATKIRVVPERIHKGEKMELDILQSIYSMHNDVLDVIMPFITKFGDAGIFWIVVGVVLTINKKTRKIGLTVMGALIFSVIFTNGILKNLVNRTRPFEYVDNVVLLVDKPWDTSFPSGHSSASMAAAVAIFIHNKKWGSGAIVLALLIAFSRLYLFVHFPTDVLAGLILGTLYAIGSALIVKKIYEKSNSKFIKY